jgi:MPBQ/MSBQ methyltransferase
MTLQKPRSNPLSFVMRLILGSAAGFYYTIVPIYMWIKNLLLPKSWAI